MLEFYARVCEECSRHITQRYSTSFSLGISFFELKVRAPIHSIYAFVRFADEIVDTFHSYDKKELLSRFEQETFVAIEEKISLNPVIHSFQSVVHKYNLKTEHIRAFFNSMKMDLYFNEYGDENYKKYIYGSAEVIGLMCLKVFVGEDEEMYNTLKTSASSLGSAFQKVNFLRDMKSDFDKRGRVYFPGVDLLNFNADQKMEIENDIQNDFNRAYEGIINLPKGCRFGVYMAYIYYVKLFRKIKRASPSLVLQKRLRIHDSWKLFLLFKSFLRHRLNWL